MIKPSNNPITLDFGATSAPYSKTSPHTGVDFGWVDAAGNENETIVMPESGIVTLVPNNGNDGNGVYFTVDNRFHGLLHTSKYLVGNGAFVEKGTPVAIMGETGAAQGVHLHWALKVNGQFVNPLDYVTEGDDMAFRMTREQILAMTRGFTWAAPGDGFDWDHYLNQDASQALYDELITALAPYSEQKMQEYASLQEQVSAGGDKATLLKPGTYQVKE